MVSAETFLSINNSTAKSSISYPMFLSYLLYRIIHTKRWDHFILNHWYNVIWKLDELVLELLSKEMFRLKPPKLHILMGKFIRMNDVSTYISGVVFKSCVINLLLDYPQQVDYQNHKISSRALKNHYRNRCRNVLHSDDIFALNCAI